MDGFGPAAELAQAIGIGFVLAAHADEAREQPAEQETVSLVAFERALGEPRVDQEARDAGVIREPEKIRPDFRLDQHDGPGMHGGKRPLHIGPAVDGVINLLHMRREFLVQLTHAG